jgi:hypothetical protein
MVPGEGDRERIGSGGFQVGRSRLTVIEVCGVPPPDGQAESRHDRCERSADDPEPGMALSDVVEQGRTHQVAAPRRPGGNAPRRRHTVRLVGDRLGPEQSGEVAREQ